MYAGHCLGRPTGNDSPLCPRPCQVLLPLRGDVQVGQGVLERLGQVPTFRLFRELLQVKQDNKSQCLLAGTLPSLGKAGR